MTAPLYAVIRPDGTRIDSRPEINMEFSLWSAAEDLESWWRSQPTPALRMTPELERVLQQTIATAEHFLTMPGTVSGVGQNLLRDVRAVRAQASQPVKLEKVRRALKCGQERLNIVFLSEETTTRWNNLFYEALAELDAAEGKAETKEGK